MLKVEGDAALATIKDANGEFRFADGKGYVWIHNLDGVMVMHPIKPALDGKGLLDMRDVNGRYLFVAMNELVEEKGEGWVEYYWPIPGTKKNVRKVSFVKGVKLPEGTEVVLGSGIYNANEAELAKLEIH